MCLQSHFMPTEHVDTNTNNNHYTHQYSHCSTRYSLTGRDGVDKARVKFCDASATRRIMTAFLGKAHHIQPQPFTPSREMLRYIHSKQQTASSGNVSSENLKSKFQIHTRESFGVNGPVVFRRQIRGHLLRHVDGCRLVQCGMHDYHLFLATLCLFPRSLPCLPPNSPDCACFPLAQMLGLLYANQNKMLYVTHIPGYPVTTEQNPPPYRSPSDHGLKHENVLIPTSDGLRLHAWFIPSTLGPKLTPTLVFFHANAGSTACVHCTGRKFVNSLCR